MILGLANTPEAIVPLIKRWNFPTYTFSVSSIIARILPSVERLGKETKKILYSTCRFSGISDKIRGSAQAKSMAARNTLKIDIYAEFTERQGGRVYIT